MPPNSADTATRKAHSTASAHLADHGRVLHIVGATIELLTPLAAADELPCLLRATIPPDGMAALPRHPDPETFVGVESHLEGLTRYADGTAWVPLHPATSSTSPAASPTPSATAPGCPPPRSYSPPPGWRASSAR